MRLRRSRLGFRRRSWRWLLTLGALMATGCSTATRTVIPPDERPLEAQTASREDLLDRVATLQAGITTLVGTDVTYLATGLGLTTGVLAQYRETEGALRVDRPDHIRMQGRAVLGSVVVFDMVSDRDFFRVSLPARNQFIVGATDSVTCSQNPLLNLRPQHILDALFVDVSAYVNNPDVMNVLEEVTQGRRRFYTLSFVDTHQEPAQLLQKIWVDRFDLSVTGKQLFAPEGVLQTNVTYDEWVETDGNWFPRRLIVERPLEDYSLEIRFREFRLNDDPVEGAFVLSQPVGSELITADTEPGSCGNADREDPRP